MWALRSRRLFFTLAVLGGPLLAYGAVMLVTDGLRLVHSDSPIVVLVGLGLPAAAVVSLGRMERRTSREITLALVGSLLLTVGLAIALIVYTISRLPPDFFN
jgi:FtsH-binding integral membrane protein